MIIGCAPGGGGPNIGGLAQTVCNRNSLSVSVEGEGRRREGQRKTQIIGDIVKKEISMQKRVSCTRTCLQLGMCLLELGPKGISATQSFQPRSPKR